jgi:hypothetical protein
MTCVLLACLAAVARDALETNNATHAANPPITRNNPDRICNHPRLTT